jgi:glycosyltransferase involved in cell wall biosynthesis
MADARAVRTSATLPRDARRLAARRRPRETTTAMVIAPVDITTPRPGGIHTFITGFVKFAPEELAVAVVGISANQSHSPLGRWRRENVEGREVQVFSVLRSDPQKRGRIPLSLRFAVGLARYRRDIRSAGVLQFHRPGTSLPLVGDGRPKVQIMHHDPSQVLGTIGENRWRLLPDAYRSVERLTARQMDAIVVVSESAAAELALRVPAVVDRISFIPNWVDDTIFALRSQAERLEQRRRMASTIGVKPNGPWVLYVGRLETTKDPALAIDAFALLAQRHPDAHLIVAGAGRLAAETERRAERLGIGRAVHMLGSIQREAIAGWMNAARALIVPSSSEAGPTSAVEALACGLPVVGTAVGRLPQLVRHATTGWIAERRTPEGLVEGLEWSFQADGEQTRQACADAARPYGARSVLEPLYELHLRLGRQARAAT